MTERQLSIRVNKLKEIDSQLKDLQDQAEKIKTELKKELDGLGVEELKGKNFIIKWKEILSNRLDTKTLKIELPDIYTKYTTTRTEKRFTIA